MSDLAPMASHRTAKAHGAAEGARDEGAALGEDELDRDGVAHAGGAGAVRRARQRLVEELRELDELECGRRRTLPLEKLLALGRSVQPHDRPAPDDLTTRSVCLGHVGVVSLDILQEDLSLHPVEVQRAERVLGHEGLGLIVEAVGAEDSLDQVERAGVAREHQVSSSTAGAGPVRTNSLHGAVDGGERRQAARLQLGVGCAGQRGLGRQLCALLAALSRPRGRCVRRCRGRAVVGGRGGAGRAGWRRWRRADLAAGWMAVAAHAVLVPLAARGVWRPRGLAGLRSADGRVGVGLQRADGLVEGHVPTVR
eukprot:scaffold16869_cov63-Phaeocystis_antarctica.AAC.2